MQQWADAHSYGDDSEVFAIGEMAARRGRYSEEWNLPIPDHARQKVPDALPENQEHEE